ncbi:MAG: C25 family cysteine peptidase, partial [Fidelibacterota bacterium]
MKLYRNSLILSGLFLSGTLFGGSTLNPAAPITSQLQIIEQGVHKAQLILTPGRIGVSNRLLNGQAYTELSLPRGYHTQKAGAPQLPAIHRLLILPEMDDAVVRITRVRWDRLDLKSQGFTAPVNPFQPAIPKNIDPATVPVVMDTALYRRSQFWGDSLAVLEKLGHFRSQALYRLRINPVRLNPVTGELKVAREISLVIDYQNADWQATEASARDLATPLFQLPSSVALDLTDAGINRDALITDPPKIVVICPADFLPALDSWVNWKERQGYTVVIGVPGQDGLGTTAAEIRSWITALYDSGNSLDPAPSFVMIVGDNGDVPGFNGATAAHHTDLYYAEATGDFLPDMYVGRLSGNSVQQIQDIVDKTILYEQQTMADPSYQLEVTMIGGVDSYYGSSHANGQINYGVNLYFNQTHDILSHTYLYPSSGSAESEILGDMNSGIGFINYTAHGSETSWADPTVTVSNVHSLTNSQKYFLAVANACLTAKYDFGECIGEAFLRQADGGAVGYIGGSNNTYWDEDYYWAVGFGPIVGSGAGYDETGLGVYDGLFHENGEDYATWCTVNGAITVRGNLAVAESGSAQENYYWEIYTLLGDPTLSTNLGQPSIHPATYPEVLLAGSSEMTIEGDPWSLVALNSDGEHLITGRLSGSGLLTLPLTDLNLTPGELELVLTAQNRIPIIDTIQFIAPDTPYLLAANPMMDD